VKNNEYRCAMCQVVYEKTWPDEEAYAEYRELFPESAKRQVDTDVVCDDCFKSMTAQLPPAQAEKDHYEQGEQ